MTFEWPTQPLRLLGVALTISLILAFPIEQVIHLSYSGGPLCSAAVQIALTLGSVIQAILTPLLVFLLPGPGSILRKKSSPKPAVQPGQAAFFISAALLCAATIPVACWYGLRESAALYNTCSLLFDLGRPIDIWHVDYFSNFAHYFIYFSVFSTFWAGMTTGGLRLQSARAAAGDGPANELRPFQGFYWACFLGWALQYRITQWCFAPLGRGQTEWVSFALYSFICLTVTALWSLAFTHSLWKKRPRTRQEAVLQAFWKSFLIPLLAMLTLILAPFLAGAILQVLVVTLNVFGLAWAFTVGSWRWRAMMAERHPIIVPQA